MSRPGSRSGAGRDSRTERAWWLGADSPERAWPARTTAASTSPSAARPMAAVNPTLHPVRLRIVQALLGNEFTTAQLRERIPDVAPATLYRHVAALHEAEVLEVVRENRVRGATERCYRLRTAELLMRSGGLTKEDHRLAFSVFTGALMADFERYLAAPDSDPDADGLAYRQAAVWLDADEHAALSAEITRVVGRYADAGPGPGRTRHVISHADIPDGGSS